MYSTVLESILYMVRELICLERKYGWEFGEMVCGVIRHLRGRTGLHVGLNGYRAECTKSEVLELQMVFHLKYEASFDESRRRGT